jgi:hypothetical protein
MANMGAGLHKASFDLDTLPKFEKNFYHEAASVTERSEREIEDFRNKKEIRVTGKHTPRPVETFEEAGFPGMLLFYPMNNANFCRICAQRVDLSWFHRTYRYPVSGMADGPIWS